jgi:hypothetical protein
MIGETPAIEVARCGAWPVGRANWTTLSWARQQRIGESKFWAMKLWERKSGTDAWMEIGWKPVSSQNDVGMPGLTLYVTSPFPIGDGKPPDSGFRTVVQSDKVCRMSHA